ncbi:MAG: tetratricopeptide repeat protein [Gammaproteobacteria bacterium]
MQDCKFGYLPNGYFNQLETINDVLFTAREIDTIACVINMRGSSKIASILDISPRTAETHIFNIKRKIDKNAREGVIDFVERSGKACFLRKHYQNLLIQADFNKKLKSIANAIHSNTPVCYFFCCNEKSKDSIIPVIQYHLKLADVKLKICSTQKEFIEPQQEEHFIFVISDQAKDQPLILKALQKSKHKPNCFSFLVIENINHNISKELVGTPYIDLLGSKNYYLTIFEIFKRLAPRIDFDNIISQLECYHQSITDQQGFLESYNNHGLKTTVTDNADLQAKIGVPRKWLMVMLFLSMLVVIVGGYSKIMFKKPDQHETNYHLFSKASPSFAITSYIPEILTGYEHFIGRQKELQQIEQKLNQDNIVIIAGQGGIGKSSCAIEYGKQHKRNKIVRYLNAESTTKIDQQYRELAQELNINVEQQPRNVVMQLVNNKLNTLSTEILFIFDNVDQYDDAKEYLINMPMNIKAIITTRQPMLIANKPHIAIEEFNNEEAEEYLKNSLQKRCLTNDFIHKLIKTAGTLPYDLKCVAAYLIDNPSVDHKIDANEIASKIKDKLFEEFIISPDQTKQQAWKILQYVVKLDPDFISINIVKELFPQDTDLSLAALKKLESLSLISIVNDQNDQIGLKIHRKLQKNVQNSVKNHQEYSINGQKVICHLLGVFNKLFPDVTFRPNTQWQTAISLQPHAEKLLNVETKVVVKKDQTNMADLYYKLAKYYAAVNKNYQQALNHAKIALERRCALYKDPHADIANSYNVIGVIYRKLGNVQEGLKYLEKGLKIRLQLYSGDHPNIADSFYTFGKALVQHGETQQGLKYSQMALEMKRRLYSSNHYEIGCSLNTVGIGYLDLGDFEKSIEYLKASLKTFNEPNPVSYEKVATLQSNIAYNYNKLGNHREALKYARASVDLFKERYPDGHPRAIYSLDDLGDSLIRTNNVKQGLDVLHQALSLSKKFSIDKHFITAFILQDLGWGYFKNKDYPTALIYTEKALNLRKELYGTRNHHERAESLYNLGDIYLALGNKNLALKSYQEALTMYTVLSLRYLPAYDEIKQKINQLANTDVLNG